MSWFANYRQAQGRQVPKDRSDPRALPEFKGRRGPPVQTVLSAHRVQQAQPARPGLRDLREHRDCQRARSFMS